MDRRDRLSTLVLAGLIVLAGAAPTAARAPQVLPEGRPGEAPTWIVMAQPSRSTTALARRFGAREVGRAGRLVVARPRAHALAAALRRMELLRWAEPNRRLRRPPRASVAASRAATWRERIGLTGLTFPAPAGAPVLALLDTPVQIGHPAFAGALVTAPDGLEPYDLHGTATASVAAATGAGGVLGVWPGMRLDAHGFNVGRMTCAQSAYLIDRVVAGGATAINMSYGSETGCFTELAALQHAVRHGVVVVAAAGNDRLIGNPMEYPAGYPHVLAVGGLGPADAAAPFSSAGPNIDLAAPATDVLAAVPPGFDPDGTPDGWSVLSGTSFAAPMVAASVTALRALRPRLAPAQVRALLCRSSRDVAPSGWDRRTGCGVLDLAAAVRAAAPAADPAEPNDDIPWIDGIGLGDVTPPVWTGGPARTLRASVTAQDDPADVYPVRLPARARTRVTLSPLSGGADLLVQSGSALGIHERGGRLAVSRRDGRATDSVTLANRARHGRLVYVAITHDQASAAREVRYRLRVQTG